MKVDSGGIRWITENIREELKALHLENHQVLCHNTAFDGAILSWVYDIHPKFLLDTLSMARPLTGLTVGGSLKALAKYFGIGEKGTEIYKTLGKRRADFTRSELDAFGVYCRQDVNLTYHLFAKLLPYTTKAELVIIDMLLRMFTEPKIELDLPRLQAHLYDVQKKKAELLARIPYSKEELMSNPKFAEVLKSLGVEPPMKVSPTTGKETYAFAKTDEAFKALLEHPDERVQAVTAARLGTKSTIEETRTESMIGIARRGPLPILLNYWGGSTGRACVVGTTQIIVLRKGTEIEIPITELLPTDFVWDGSAFVPHEGLIDQGVREVMEYQGLTATPDHRVYVEECDEAVRLSEASERGYKIKTAGSPCAS
nr:hypothetical protein [uncultured Parasutterella sp.]